MAARRLVLTTQRTAWKVPSRMLLTRGAGGRRPGRGSRCLVAPSYAGAAPATLAAPMASAPVDIEPGQNQGLAREGRDTPGHRNQSLAVIMVICRGRRRGTAEGVAEIAPQALGLGQPRQGLGADVARRAGDGIASDILLPVGVPDRVMHVVYERNEIRRALAGGCDGGLHRCARIAESAQVGERVGVDTSRREGGESCLQLADRIGDASRAGLFECRREITTGLHDEGVQRGLRSQGLDLEGLHRIEEGRRSAHRFEGCLERDARPLALTGRATSSATPPPCSANPSSWSASATFPPRGRAPLVHSGRRDRRWSCGRAGYGGGAPRHPLARQQWFRVRAAHAVSARRGQRSAQ